jgi:hypothetical protein
MIKVLIVLIFSAFCILSCSKDKLQDTVAVCNSQITYINQIKPIIDKSCAYSTCHVSGFSNGSYISYKDMEKHLLNGKFDRWVINDRAMPPSYAPQGKPTSLTPEELNLILCWKKDNFIEK